MLVFPSASTPRRLLNLIQSCADVALAQGDNWITPEVARFALSMLGYDDNGYTDKEIKYLTELSKGKRGLDALASLLGTDRQDVERRIEPPLTRRGYVDRSGSGRVLTPIGAEMLRKNYGI